MSQHKSALVHKLMELAVARTKELNCKITESLANPTVEMEILQNNLKEISNKPCFVILTVGEIETMLYSMHREASLTTPKDNSWAYCILPTLKKLQDAIK